MQPWLIDQEYLRLPSWVPLVAIAAVLAVAVLRRHAAAPQKGHACLGARIRLVRRRRRLAREEGVQPLEHELLRERLVGGLGGVRDHAVVLRRDPRVLHRPRLHEAHERRHQRGALIARFAERAVVLRDVRVDLHPVLHRRAEAGLVLDCKGRRPRFVVSSR